MSLFAQTSALRPYSVIAWVTSCEPSRASAMARVVITSTRVSSSMSSTLRLKVALSGISTKVLALSSAISRVTGKSMYSLMKNDSFRPW